jgi:hypothetical protein
MATSIAVKLVGLYTRGAEKFLALKKTTRYMIEKMYLLYIFPPELHTLMTSLF